jgi:PhnB protein
MSALFKRAIAAGATEQVPMSDQFWGDRSGAVGYPAGFSWWIASRTEDLKMEEIRERAEAMFKKMAGTAAP